jgi:hypothetical protein
MALITTDQNGDVTELVPSAVQVGLGVTKTGKGLEIAGNIVSRLSRDSGSRAIAIATEADVHGSIWTNAAYNPDKSGSGWKRTINLVNGNVGIGGSKDAAALAPTERLVVAGNILATGDVRLAGGDCAEDFDVDDLLVLEPGMVMVIGEEERLHQCSQAYDRRVAGVLSGAGDCQPGIILGKRLSQKGHLPLALTGKVYCKVDASFAPIGIGDLLTTSSNPGHAMKATDPGRAFGTVLGKALRPLPNGIGLVPILVSLQ